MSTSRKDNRRGKKRRSGKGKKNNFTPTQFESLQCSICGEIIEDVTSAMCSPTGEEPAHFDCIIKQLSEKEELKENELIVYLGSNHFAVVQKEDYNKRQINIIRTIDFHRIEEREEWRIKMRNEITC